MKTTKEEHEQVKQYIKQLKKLNKKGKIKILESDYKIDKFEPHNHEGNITSLGKIKGKFVDIAYYVYE